MSEVILPAKFAGETKLYEFDFTSQIATAETILTKVTTCSVYSGTDASPSALIAGAASSTGQVVTQSITGGVLGVIYQLLCTITTSLGQTLQLAGYLVVEPPLP